MLRNMEPVRRDSSTSSSDFTHSTLDRRGSTYSSRYTQYHTLALSVYAAMSSYKEIIDSYYTKLVSNSQHRPMSYWVLTEDESDLARTPLLESDISSNAARIKQKISLLEHETTEREKRIKEWHKLLSATFQSKLAHSDDESNGSTGSTSPPPSYDIEAGLVKVHEYPANGQNIQSRSKAFHLSRFCVAFLVTVVIIAVLLGVLGVILFYFGGWNANLSGQTGMNTTNVHSSTTRPSYKVETLFTNPALVVTYRHRPTISTMHPATVKSPATAQASTTLLSTNRPTASSDPAITATELPLPSISNDIRNGNIDERQLPRNTSLTSQVPIDPQTGASDELSVGNNVTTTASFASQNGSGQLPEQVWTSTSHASTTTSSTITAMPTINVAETLARSLAETGYQDHKTTRHTTTAEPASPTTVKTLTTPSATSKITLSVVNTAPKDLLTELEIEGDGSPETTSFQPSSISQAFTDGAKPVDTTLSTLVTSEDSSSDNITDAKTMTLIVTTPNLTTSTTMEQISNNATVDNSTLGHSTTTAAPTLQQDATLGTHSEEIVTTSSEKVDVGDAAIRNSSQADNEELRVDFTASNQHDVETDNSTVVVTVTMSLDVVTEVGHSETSGIQNVSTTTTQTKNIQQENLIVTTATDLGSSETAQVHNDILLDSVVVDEASTNQTLT